MSSVFLYNSELWSITSTIANSIDVFHRRLLIRTSCQNIHWRKIVPNKKLYDTTNETPWEYRNKKTATKLVWPYDPTAIQHSSKIALQHAPKPTIRPRGQQKTTWTSMMKKRFQEYDLKWEEAYDMAKNRIEWRKFVEHSWNLVFYIT